MTSFGSVPTTPDPNTPVKRIAIQMGAVSLQIGGVQTIFCQEEGILLQKYRDRNGRCIAILFKSIKVGGRFHGCSSFACSWKLPAYHGAFLLTVVFERRA